MVIRENIYDNKSFMYLRNEVDFMPYLEEDSLKSLENSLYTIFIYDDLLNIIACGRVIGDGVTTFFLKDIIVSEKCKGEKYGDIIIKHIENYILENGTENSYVGLFSTNQSINFYKRNGYNIRPNDLQGPALHKYIRRSADE